MKKGWKEELADSLSQTSGAKFEDAFSSLCAPKGAQADWCSTLAFSLAKTQKANPVALATKWANEAKWPKFVSRAQASGPYLNFYFAKNFWGKIVGQISKSKKPTGKKQKIIIEFPSVNPNKPWHAGHMRNAILGDSLANVLSKCGYDVQRIDYIDDLGLQVAQSVWGEKNLPYANSQSADEKFAKKTDHVFGRQYVQVAKRIEEPQVNAQVRALLKKLEEGEGEEALQARKTVEKIVGAQYETAFMLGIYHDALIFESDIVRDIFAQGLEMIKKSGVLVLEEQGKNAGCWVVRLQGASGFEGLENADKIMIRSDGTATYTGKDVAFQLYKFGLLKNRFSFCEFIAQPNGKVAYMTCRKGEKMKFANAQTVVNVIGAEQAYPQKVICAVLERMGYVNEAKNSIHLAYEHVVLPQGKFSGRAGTWMGAQGEMGFSADELIDEVIKRARERINVEYNDEQKDKIAHAVGCGALRFSILRPSANQKIVFDMDRALSLSGDSGPYVQYAYARAFGIMAKAKEAGMKIKVPDAKYQYSEQETELLRFMLSWNDTLDSCAKNYQVHPVCEFAIGLAGAFNKFYTTSPVLNEKDEKKKSARLAIVYASSCLLAQCMEVIGIERLEKM